MSSTTRLTRYVSATTIVTSDVANMWYGGLYGSSEASLYASDHPLIAGHIHDGLHVDGHAQRVHLVDHITGQITNPNIGDQEITPRNINSYTLEENAIPYIDLTGEYKLNLSMVTPSMGFGAFIEVPVNNLIKHTNEDYSSTGVNFVFGSSSLDDTGTDPDPLVIEDGDCRMLFDRERAAFRAGCATLDQWDAGKRGWGSVGIGVNPTASGIGSVTIGTSSTASGVGSVAIGASSTASGVGSVIIGMSHSALSDYSGVFSGNANDIVSGSDYSVIAGGNNNDIGNSTHCFIAAGRDNRIIDSTFSSVMAGYENYNGGASSAVGGRGVGLLTGDGSFVWGYDSGMHTETVTGNQLFIIGTGAVDNDEKYKLGVNTNTPHPAGEMGAHIVGSIDAGSSPLRLENLTNSDSQDALCVDSYGNVFVSNHLLDQSVSVPRTQVITFEHYRVFPPSSGTTQCWRYRSTATSPSYGYAYVDLASPWGDLSTSYPSCPVLVFPYQGDGGSEGPLGTVRFSLMKGEVLKNIILHTDLDNKPPTVDPFIRDSIYWRLKVSKINYKGGEHIYLAGGEGNSYVLSEAPSFNSNPGWDGTGDSALGSVQFSESNFGIITGGDHYIYSMQISPNNDEAYPSYLDGVYPNYNSRVWFIEVITETSADLSDFVSSPTVSSR